jgi:hypothetical protein
MRFTFVILLFLSFGANAQMIIKAHPNYVPFATTNLFLDVYTGSSAAYSLRKLRTAYTGSAIRVRKDTTGQPEQDIGFTANGDFDTSSLKSFINARSGFVVSWYDQSGNTRTATQATQANQPRIALTGVIDRIAGDPSVFFDGTNDNLRADGVATDFTGEDKPITAVQVVNKTNTNTAGNIIGFGRSTSDNPLISTQLDQVARYLYNTRDDAAVFGQRIGGTYTSNTNYLLFWNSTGTNANVYSNNSLVLTGSVNTGTITLNRFTIGALTRTTTAGYFGGYISENILYASDKDSDRSGMQTNINTYYGIY